MSLKHLLNLFLYNFLTRSTHKKELSSYTNYIIEFSTCTADLAILTTSLIYSRSQGSLLNSHNFKKFVSVFSKFSWSSEKWKLPGQLTYILTELNFFEKNLDFYGHCMLNSCHKRNCNRWQKQSWTGGEFKE